MPTAPQGTLAGLGTWAWKGKFPAVRSNLVWTLTALSAISAYWHKVLASVGKYYPSWEEIAIDLVDRYLATHSVLFLLLNFLPSQYPVLGNRCIPQGQSLLLCPAPGSYKWNKHLLWFIMTPLHPLPHTLLLWVYNLCGNNKNLSSWSDLLPCCQFFTVSCPPAPFTPQVVTRPYSTVPWFGAVLKRFFLTSF